MAKFERLAVWYDTADRTAAEQMAVDEALLRAAHSISILRVYRWAEPAITVGYFEDAGTARDGLNAQRVPLVRRFTGGGSVLHGDDLPYTLIVPKMEAARSFGEDRARSYAVIHRAVASSLRKCGWTVVNLASDGGQQPGIPCFIAPVAEDLILGSTGKKIAGAGQRRTREGMIHQGSIALDGRNIDDSVFAELLAGELADRQTPLELSFLDRDFDSRMRAHLETRYATTEWNRDVLSADSDGSN